jgi:hypothetical protein
MSLNCEGRKRDDLPYVCLMSIKITRWTQTYRLFGAQCFLSHTFHLADVVKSIFTLRWTRSVGTLFVWNTRGKGDVILTSSGTPGETRPTGVTNCGSLLFFFRTSKHNSENFKILNFVTLHIFTVFQTECWGEYSHPRQNKYQTNGTKYLALLCCLLSAFGTEKKWEKYQGNGKY